MKKGGGGDFPQQVEASVDFLSREVNLLSNQILPDSRKKRWQYYDLAFGPVRVERLELYESLFHQNASRPVRDILELGCGTGRWLTALSKRGYRMTGVDFDDAALNLAREKCKEMGLRVRLIEQDLASWAPDDSYDAVIAPNNALKWLPDHDLLRRCITQAALALRPGSILVLDLTFEEANWRFCDWGTEDELREHAWVSKFTDTGVSGEYRCCCGVPNLDKGLILFIERFFCQEHSKEVVLEYKTTWLLFSAGEFTDWVLETGLLENIKFYDRKAHIPIELAQSDLEDVGGQCLMVCRRKSCLI
ncbi:class I SAM-dependent methyltransferase [Candidatus Poribacteria bacterium]|nr:class I SAM-dependent methyltransferase [Candidatus Poribacteria bacterium]